MTIKQIRKALEDALLFGGAMSQELYQFELEEIKGDLLTSLRQDNDAFIFAVTENKKSVAMILIEQPEDVYVNEQARIRLQELWPLGYESNLRKLIPLFAQQLREGELPVNGVKVVKRA